MTFINLIALHSFVSYDCCRDLKAVWIRGKRFLLYGLFYEVATNTKLLLSVLAFEVLKFSMGILATFRIASWIKFCGYSWEYKTFWSSSKRSFLTWLFLTMVQFLLASVKGILLLHCLGLKQLNGTHLRVSAFYKTCPSKCCWFQELWYHDIKKW